MYEEKLLLGLDIGPNSLGWAIIGGITEGSVFRPKKLKDAGVRIFAEGVDRTAQGSEISKSAARRQARSARRVHQRRNRRRDLLKQILQEAGLLPMDEKELLEVLHENPYKLRADGLTNKLSPYSFGRSIYHLGQRRGFKSNRKSDRKADEGVLQKGRNSLHEKMGDRTVGEYLYNEYLSKGETRFRNIELAVPDRAMYEEELQRLWAAQRAYYPDLLTEKLRQAITPSSSNGTMT